MLVKYCGKREKKNIYKHVVIGKSIVIRYYLTLPSQVFLFVIQDTLDTYTKACIIPVLG